MILVCEIGTNTERFFFCPAEQEDGAVSYIKSGLKWWIIAQNASPSRQEVVMFSTFTPGYPSTRRLHHNSRAFVPRRSLILRWMRSQIIICKKEERKRFQLAIRINLCIDWFHFRKIPNNHYCGDDRRNIRCETPPPPPPCPSTRTMPYNHSPRRAYHSNYHLQWASERPKEDPKYTFVVAMPLPSIQSGSQSVEEVPNCEEKQKRNHSHRHQL